MIPNLTTAHLFPSGGSTTDQMTFLDIFISNCIHKIPFLYPVVIIIVANKNVYVFSQLEKKWRLSDLQVQHFSPVADPLGPPLADGNTESHARCPQCFSDPMRNREIFGKTLDTS